MGAGGSTAASCSSLDLANHKQHYRHHHQHHLHEQRMQKYRKQANFLPGPPPKPAKGLAIAANNVKSSSSNLLIQSSHSNFDLTQKNPQMHENKQQNIIKLQADWFGGETKRLSGAYNLVGGESNSRPPPTRPILVLPNNVLNKPLSPVHVISGAKRSNAGVASRLHHLNQRRINQANELRKFSDSLPSLNNLLDQQQQNHHHHHQPYHHNGHEPISPVSPSYVRLPTTSYCLGQENLFLNHKSAKQQPYLDQQIIMQSHRNGGNNNYPNRNLVSNSSRCDDSSSYPNWSSANEPSMKRAISLSSLHNSHNNNHQQQQQYQQCLASNMHNAKQLVNNCGALQSHVRKNEFSSNTTNNNTTFDLQQQQPCYKHASGYMKQHQQQQQQQMQYNQPTQLAKKILKFKQVAANSGLSSKRYKKKQKQIQQQQQGCPVLPPLPRSQSLHELIQLRATENGQRMRTTGTLRGPLGSSGETGNKVNLVVELLENRRQQKIESEQQQRQQISNSRDSTETMLSQTSSSSDDGIHDVSISGGDQSTGDSRRTTASANTSHAKTSNVVAEIAFSNSGSQRLSMTGQQESEKRQGIFNRNHQSSDRSRQRFAVGKGGANQNQQQFYERPQSQRLYMLTNHHVEDSHIKKSKQDSQPHKSTLKRSVSHSALQSNLHNLELNNNDDRDEDESDDLNELARFLYQFKQRQQQSKSSTGGDSLREPNISTSSVVNPSKSIPSSPQQNQKQQQQSPNSTASSSGFASSTCTSVSISSTASGGSDGQPRLRANIEEPETSKSNHIESSSQKKQQQSRKKYPAPKRPDDNGRQSRLQSISKTKNAAQIIKDQTATGNNKNLISGQLKLSSSLLSIVDEYNSTLRANDRINSPAITGSTSSNLAPVLLGKAGLAAPIITTITNKIEMDNNASPLANRLKAGSRHSFNNANDSSSVSSTSSSPYCHRQQHKQLEQLRRYTQMRQMSQSELALNHLTSSSGHHHHHQQQLKTQIPQVKGKNVGSYDQHNNNNKPYKSKLINIIRRISDKSEPAVADCGNGVVGRHSRLSACSASAIVSAPDRAVATTPVGGDHIAGKATAAHQVNLMGGGEKVAINQKSKLIAPPYSNQCSSKQKYNHLKPELQKSLPDGASKSCLSESLCDLNFDCDFELIKNCGNEHRRAVVGKSSLLPGNSGGSSSSAAISHSARAAERCCHNNKEMVAKQHHQAASNLSRGENNWRLVQNPLSLDKQQASLPSRQSLDGAKENSCSNSRGLAKGKLQAVSQATNKMASEHQQQQVKLKWSASGWLMNSIGAGSGMGVGGSSNGKSNRTKGNELSRQQQQQQQQQQQLRLAPANSATKDDSGGKSCLSKLISNSRTPSSIAAPSSSSSSSTNNNNNINDGGSNREQALIESMNNKGFAKLNSEAKQLLNELDHSLDLVSGGGSRYPPFSRKVALSGWWKTSMGGSDGYTTGTVATTFAGTNNGMEERFGHHPNEFAISSSSSVSNSDSDLDDNDDDDDDDYASINRAMINATFDVDVNQIKLNDSLSIEPGSPSDSFTFSASNSPVSASKLTNQTLASASNYPIKQTLGQPSSQSKGENHMKSKQTPICQTTNGCLLAGEQQQQIYSQIRNSDSSRSNGNHGISSSHGTTSHGISSGIKLADNGNVGACIGANTKHTFVSHGDAVDDDGEMVRRIKGEYKGAVGGKGELEDARNQRKKKLVGGGKQFDSDPMAAAAAAANDRPLPCHKDSGNISYSSLAGRNQDLCAHEQHEVLGSCERQQQSHLKMNGSHTASATASSCNNVIDDDDDKHDSFCELNRPTKRLMGSNCCCRNKSCRIPCNSSPKTTITGSHDDNDDISRPNETTNINSNRLLASKCQSDGNGKNISVNGCGGADGQDGCWNQVHKNCRGLPSKTTKHDKNGHGEKNSRPNCCASCSQVKLNEGIKSNGSVSIELPGTSEAQNVAHLPSSLSAIQGQLSCVGLGQEKEAGVPLLSSCRCCCSFVAAGPGADTTNCATAIARDNGNMSHMNGQKQEAMAAKCDGQISSPKEHKLNGNNGRQIVVVDNLVEPPPPPSEIRPSCCSSSSSSVGNFGASFNGDKKALVGCRCCSNSSGGDGGGGGGQGEENIFTGLRHLHTATVGNGVTYSKTTAPKSSEELKNKLITPKQQKQHHQKPLCHCSSSVGGGFGGNSFPTTTVTQTAHSNDHLEISGKTTRAHQARPSSSSQQLKQPLAASNSNSFNSKSAPADDMVAADSTESSGFYYYDMDRIYSRQNDKQMTAMDRIVGSDGEMERAGASKVASCRHHHPSSTCKLSGCCNSCGDCSSKTSYNEDVKLKRLQQQHACVIRDNLILETGHGGAQHKQLPHSTSSPPSSSSFTSLDDRSLAAENVAAVVAATETSGDRLSNCPLHRLSSINCRCCIPQSTKKQPHHHLHYPSVNSTVAADQQHHPEMNGILPGKRFNGVGKFSSPNRTTTNGDLYPAPKSSPNGRLLCATAATAAPIALSGAPRLICKSRQVAGKPICRSNSELVQSPDNKGFLGRINIGKLPPSSDGNHRQQDEQPRLSSQRNTLLNNNNDSKMESAAKPTTRAASLAQDALLACKGSKLASSQVSLANHYKAGGGHFVSPFIAHLDKQQQHLLHRNHYGSTTALNDQIDVEDNFILKRKTPNAGLKSLC